MVLDHLFFKKSKLPGDHVNPLGHSVFFPPLIQLGKGREVPGMPSQCTSVMGSWCNALLGALEHTTGCDSGLRDVSQFPG